MIQIESIADRLLTRRRWVIHVGYWFFVLLFYVVFFGRKNSNYIETAVFVGLLMPVTVATTYFLNYWLVPNYLMQKRHFMFLLYFAYTLIGSVFLEMMIAIGTFILIASLQNKKMNPVAMDLVFMLTSLLMVVFLGMAIKMVLHWRKSDEDNQRLLKDKAELELKFLKTQLHPHFLFNTLNNLYYLSLEKSEKAPKAVLALSELLDYVLHETHATFVQVETELRQLQNYVALESLRYDDRLDVEINVSPTASQRRIIPMLLITLLENSFKHGVSKTTERAWIHVEITAQPEKTVIRVKNSIAAGSENGNDGLGLTSIRGQLNMLYQERAHLQVSTERDSFEVKIELTEAG